MEPSAAATTSPHTHADDQTTTSAAGSEKIICNGCKLTLEENGTASDSVVVSFGNSLWHVDCFRCAKCRNLVEHDTNLLLLSDGSPVCENCSYICSVCKLPISNEAIVTGEESYHADCFRCRSCSNRIEELIFAKTSQGIYCMTCHNERVTRSRRHAEAKRNKSSNANPSGSKKDRERDKDRNPSSSAAAAAAGANSSSNNRSKSKTSQSSTGAQKSPQPPGSSTQSTFNIPSSSTDPSFPNSIGNLPNFPPPGDPTKSSLSSLPNTPHTHQPLNSKSSSSSLLNSYLNNQTGLASSHGSGQANQEADYFDQSNRTLQASMSPSQMLATRRRGGSASSVQPLPINQAIGLRPHEPIQQRPNGSPQNGIPRPSSAGGNGLSISPLHSHYTSSAFNRSYESSPHLPTSPANPPQNKSGSATRAPTEKNNNSLADPADSKSRSKHRSVSLSTYDEMNIQSALQSPPSHPGTGSDGDRALNSAFSYGDIFSSLDHNPDDPTRLLSQLELSAINLENLLATPTAMDSRDPRAGPTAGRPEIEEIARKVRESITLSRDKPNHATELGLDVGLVEKLLWELDETKERMKAVQEEYHQMRRVSRSAYEGFSLARQKYDSQVTQREEAEVKMNELKARMIEQASRLKEMDSLRTLEYQSEELKDSVSGLQKHVTQLVAERDFRLAEVEALDDMNDQIKKGGGHPTNEAISVRFDQLRQRYLQEVQDLAHERDRLKEEVNHLTKIKESQAKELASMNQRQDALSEMNATAVKRLEETKTTTSRMLGRQVIPAALIKPSLQSPTTQTSGQSISQESDFPIQMSPEVNIATTRKFKWGKSHAHKASTAASSRHHHAKNASSISTPESIGINNMSGGTGGNDNSGNHHSTNSNAVNHPPHNSSSGNLALNQNPNTSNHATTNSISILATNSMVALRPHNFQPVSALRPVRCDYCGDKLWGLAEVRCTACGSYSHTKCAANFFGCHASNPGGGSGNNNNNSSHGSGGLNHEEDVESVLFGNDLVAQAKSENKLVPSVVTKCIEAVEEQAIKFEGIYRKTGGMSSVKMIQNCFEKGQSMNFNDLDKFNDISAITSTLKNYFRQLPNPLFTFELHEAFVTVASMAQENIRLEALERVIYQLPGAHFETLKVLMIHLSNIEKQCEHNKMNSQNLGVIFGPTLLRSPNPNRQFSDMPFTAKIVELTVLNRAQLFRKPYGTNTVPPTNTGLSSSTTTSSVANNNPHPSNSNPSISSHHHHLLNHPSSSSPNSNHHHTGNGNLQQQQQQQHSSSPSNSHTSNISCNPQSSSNLTT
ncbi:hypothetical protein MJO28_016246 [Puccinia striiformis f. sp. tritici]|uniref:Signal transducer n=4 Tax=Puccinia striiformis TaxID=27350 RepID=A0A0L0VZM6_9BASI|nr:hypothetical protein Pst134EA_030625 [Puccinia striiformis f. sp. tritici]KAI9601982.1 hypothetical protein KEM48_001272 [Puccinia striiformis f. sp. tritici PST-130]KNF04731.1 hypothetical protein PSTG_02213 [Puccinia striiformis f. sp. tritici PST-78]POW08253.1 hypothetical protein PSTT_07692 [Puccinia striiformis]KAH9440544.1 hypothetical protein Pst134EB_031153 [Puccinia striiformis f. sp. tritici]KAH9446718.1 hypothetical protein Pst134EA_030625 [Puccinia striiformis f. sp. tritici]